MMKLKQMLEESLREKRRPEFIELRDFLIFPCAAQHAYRLNEDRRKEKSRLKSCVEDEFKKTFRTYLKEAFEDFFELAFLEINDVVKVSVLGMLGDSFVSAVYVDYDDTLSPVAKIIGAYLAAKSKNTSIIIQINRDSLLTTAWKVEVGSSDLIKDLEMDANYLKGIVSKEAKADGIDSECRVCSYKDECTVEEKFKAKPLPISGVKFHRDKSFEQKIDDYLISINDRDDGRNNGNISPSEMSISSCDRRIAYKILKTERRAFIPAKLRKVFDMGHAIHEVLQRMLHEKSEVFKSEETARVEGTLISGSCDGFFEKEGLEIKSISGAGFSKLTGPKADHKKQGAIYCSALGLTKMLFVYYNKKTGETASFYESFDSKLAGSLIKRARGVENAVKNDELPERVTGWGCKTCPYQYTCEPELR